jgi:hemerythrin-like metal-binding protein
VKHVEDLNRFLVRWDPSYSVGADEIDRQHRFLIFKIRDLQEAMAAGSAAGMLAPLIHNLATYTRYHFAFEGRLYGERGYPDLDRHLALHAHLAQQVTDLGTALQSGKLHAGAPVLAFLQHWLVDHILGEDIEAFSYKAPVDQPPGS